jgi:hypothetical protein
MAYVSMQHFWVQNPFHWLWVRDINLQTEFFAPHKTRQSLMSFKGNSPQGLGFLDDMIRYLYHFPFGLSHFCLDRMAYINN